MSYYIRNICISIAIFLYLFTCTKSVAQALESNSDTCYITGIVTDEKKEPLIGATIQLLKNNIPVKGCQTDADGYYSISMLDTGRYDMVIAYVFYKTSRITGIMVKKDSTITINKSMEVAKNYNTMEISMCCCYRPMIEKWPHPTGQTFTSEQIEKMAH